MSNPHPNNDRGAQVFELRPLGHDEPVQLVDPPEPPKRLRPGEVELQPILPMWASSRRVLAENAKRQAAHAAHVAAFHAVRIPKYAALVALRAPAGAARALGQLLAWISDQESLPVQQAMRELKDPTKFHAVRKERRRRTKRRTIAAAAAGLTTVAPAVGLVAVSPDPVQWTAAGLVTLAAARYGSPRDRPIIGRAVLKSRVEPLRADVVERALRSIGLPGLKDEKAMIDFPVPIMRDGPGWRAEVDLPHGMTVTEVANAREKLASGLRRPETCVWPEGVRGQHAGRLVIWVADEPMRDMPNSQGPLGEMRERSLFDPVPFGTDQRGQPVSVNLMYANGLIGAMSGAGKTFALRNLALAAALDPTAQLLIADFGGKGDFKPFQEVAHDCALGRDDETLMHALSMLQWVHDTEMARRAKVLSSLPEEECPENKTIPALAARRDLGLHPLVIVIDEVQNLLGKGRLDEQTRKLAERYATGIIKLGRALGIICLFATQRPDKDSIPTGVSSNASLRFCLKVTGQTENDLVLGTSMYKQGVRATVFEPELDRGIGMLVGSEGGRPKPVRTYFISNEDAKRIVQHARALREQRGMLTGHAAGQGAVTDRRRRDLLDDLLGVFKADEERVWLEALAQRLTILDQAVYGGWDAKTLGSAARPRNLTPLQVWGRDEDGQGSNRWGLTRAQILAAQREEQAEEEASDT